MLTVTVNLSKHVTDAHSMYHINKCSFNHRELIPVVLIAYPFHVPSNQGQPLN